jgi:hypothetical protein
MGGHCSQRRWAQLGLPGTGQNGIVIQPVAPARSIGAGAVIWMRAISS